MRSLIVIAAFALFSSLGWADDRPAGIPEEARYAKVDRVIDGDTIVLMDRTRVRLEGIDAPERDQPYGPVATAALEYMVGRAIYYVETDEDRYERMLATLALLLVFRRVWERIGAGDRSRTYDLRITNALLYQLSYTGTGRGY